MRQQLTICLLCVVILSSGLVTLTQAQTTPPQPVYVGYTYIKTNPGKFDAYDSLLRNYTKKIFDAEIKNGNYYMWSTYEVLMPTGSEADYNVVGITVSSKIEMLLDPPGTPKELFAKTFPNLTAAQRDNIIKNYAANRTIVKREIYSVISSTGEDGPPTKTPAKYVQVDFMTPVAGKEQEYVKMESETFKPVHLQRMKLGAVKGWVLLGKVLPGDTNDPAPFVTVNFYDDFSGMMNGKYDEAVKSAYPDKDADKVFAQIGTVKKGQRIEVWKLMSNDTMQGTVAK